MEEIWKDIDGYEGLYQVSNLGRVKSFPKKTYSKERILTNITNVDGYNVVDLCKNGTVKDGGWQDWWLLLLFQTQKESHRLGIKTRPGQTT